MPLQELMADRVPALIVAAGLLALWWWRRDSVLRWGRVVWVCRISALSAGLGLLLFLLAQPARDLFVETGPNAAYWSLFFVLALAWALIVHYAGRKVLEQQAWAARGRPLPLLEDERDELRAEYTVAATWVPRLLGLLCFVAIGLGIWGADRDLGPIKTALARGDVPTTRSADLLVGTALTCLVYLAIVVFRQFVVRPDERRKSFGQFLTDSLRGSAGRLLTEPRLFWFTELATERGRRTRRTVQGTPNLRWDAIALALICAEIGVWLMALALPHELGTLFPRALFVVVMLGLPVFLLAFLSALSHQLRMPALALMLLACLVLTGWVSHFHDTRTLPAPDGGRGRQIDLVGAVKAWKDANCPPVAGQPNGPCTRQPVIVASAGGASRAGFFTASVVGDLLDITRQDSRAYNDFGRQLFAFSGVSGGSVGAVMIRAALADSQGSGSPCRRLDNLWFAAKLDRQPSQWKACLQTLLAGDFLSPAFVGLSFRDGLAFIIYPLAGQEDRAVLLEQAFERRYAKLLHADGQPPPPGLTAAFGWNSGGDRSKAWLPLLFLNATSVDTGRRSIIAETRPDYCVEGRARRLFPEAYDFFETIASAPVRSEGVPSNPCRPEASIGAPEAAGARDVSLSTAATVSARFPVISPQATVRKSDRGPIADLLVDGGYFENDGVTTAYELARAVREIDPALTPVVVHITNDIVAERPDEAGPDRAAPPPNPPGREGTWYESFVDPFLALVGTRGGHAAAAVRRVQDDGNLRYVRFQVYDTMPVVAQSDRCSLDGLAAPPKGEVPAGKVQDLSMSWWLSGAVQAYLDRQLCHPLNQKAFQTLKSYLILNVPS